MIEGWELDIETDCKAQRQICFDYISNPLAADDAKSRNTDLGINSMCTIMIDATKLYFRHTSAEITGHARRFCAKNFCMARGAKPFPLAGRTCHRPLVPAVLFAYILVSRIKAKSSATKISKPYKKGVSKCPLWHQRRLKLQL